MGKSFRIGDFLFLESLLNRLNANYAFFFTHMHILGYQCCKLLNEKKIYRHIHIYHKPFLY